MRKGEYTRHSTIHPDQDAILFIDEDGYSWVSFIEDQPKDYPFLGELLSERRREIGVVEAEPCWVLPYEGLS